MAESSANARRFDQYKNFKFRVKLDGRYVAGAGRASNLARTTEVVTQREGSDPSRVRTAPGRTVFGGIMLERGVTHDTAFAKWARSSSDIAAVIGSDVVLRIDRRDLVIEIFDEAGEVEAAYKVFGASVSEYRARADLDASAGAVTIQSMTLLNEGWERIDGTAAAIGRKEPSPALVNRRPPRRLTLLRDADNPSSIPWLISADERTIARSHDEGIRE